MGKLNVGQLEKLGFFRHVPAVDLARVRAEIERGGYPFPQETRRGYYADAENLAERGVLDFLGDVAPFLRHEGVPIEVDYRVVKYPATKTRPSGRGAARLDAEGWIDKDGPGAAVASLRLSLARGSALCELTEDDWEDGGAYSLFAGDREIVLYGGERAEGVDDWTSATFVTRALLSELLEAHGSTERAYAIYGGNDSQIIFATPDMARLINAASTPNEKLHDGVGNEVI